MSGVICGAGETAVVLANTDDTTVRALHAWMTSHLAEPKMPSRWWVVDEIPRTSRGKINREAVKAYGIAHDDFAGLPGFTVAGVSQEHGQITGAAPIDFEKFPVGTRLRILPNHSCLTAAAYDRYHVLDGGHEVIATWTRTNGW